ncbi:hypothetical protein [Bradyrhizobium sp. AS23.2]|uniref:hypothetical protein n=1 Tax=Bradyrhizobium sp. AS23.2 TaxID=1680155 RepID=UPI00093B49D7|nr:hypothetical protein [Bradyrhizobium sp. AS23.2]OKO80577.1 hypothetical protein AC630_15405 [Bradyrhizobium sp. AS23.2]
MNVLPDANSDLMNSPEAVLEAPPTFAACLNAHGLYNTMQFVLRLSPRIHQLLDAVPSGVYPRGEVDGETIVAYSTYLHETVHWWQHIGSTTGLIVSLCYPAQAHANLDALKEVVRRTGLNKSLLKWAEDAARSGTPSTDEGIRNANTAVNNAIDVEFFKLFIMQPERAREINAEHYFECVGHSFRIAYTLALELIATAVDPDYVHIPDVTRWASHFDRLTSEQVEGFYYGTPIRVGPVGVRAIFEGQARFIQLQYLAFGSQKLDCATLGDAGYFEGIYGDAFRVFLKLTGAEWPDSIEDPLVGLFLLICDLAINPSAGFPCDIEDFHNFILDTDPGIRFGNLCLAAKQSPELWTAVQNYSREEYVAVSEALMAACEYDHSLRGLEEVARWPEKVPAISELMAEKETFAFGVANLPVRVVLSHFIAFSIDKLAHPEFFCWAGAWMAGPRTSDEVQKMFLRHLSIYADRGDKEGIYPRDIPGKDQASVFQTLNMFYGNNLVYDLTRQWILQNGPFKYDYSWLTENPPAKYAEWANKQFEKLYGAHPDAVNIL